MIKYYKGYKYVLAETVERYGPIKPTEDIVLPDECIELYKDGLCRGLKGFPWDGASGPTFDTKSVMEPSFWHDIICRLHKLGYLTDAQRKQGDKQLAKDMKDRKNWFIRVRIWYRGVRWESKHHRHGPKKVHTAP